MARGEIHGINDAPLVRREHQRAAAPRDDQCGNFFTSGLGFLLLAMLLGNLISSHKVAPGSARKPLLASDWERTGDIGKASNFLRVPPVMRWQVDQFNESAHFLCK
jgi:hypothetical protein